MPQASRATAGANQPLYQPVPAARQREALDLVLGQVFASESFRFDPALMTPKLMAKVVTVTVLTVNACAIAWVAMPILHKARGRSIAELPARTRSLLSLIGGISTASWILALAMGVSKVLAASPAATFVYLMPAAYVAATLGAATLLLGVRPVAAVRVH